MSLTGLTVHSPWAWAIFHAGKPVENRGWIPPAWLLMRHLAIHAGKTYDHEGATWIRTTFGIHVPAESELPKMAIVGVVKLVGWFECDPDAPKPTVDSNWMQGPYCWELEERIALPEPVKIRGAQKLWSVPKVELELVRSQWVKARHAASLPVTSTGTR